jgi:hypothetical protein
MENHLPSNLGIILMMAGGGLVIFCAGIMVGIVWRTFFVKEIAPEDEHLYFPQKKVDNKNV